jgi:hypothetical protein
VSQTMKKAALALIAAVSLHAHALQIISLSPQGEVARVRQVVAKFDEAAVPSATRRRRAAVAELQRRAGHRGTGRWISEREWAFEFENDLPPGVSCAVQWSAPSSRPKASR